MNAEVQTQLWRQEIPVVILRASIKMADEPVADQLIQELIGRRSKAGDFLTANGFCTARQVAQLSGKSIDELLLKGGARPNLQTAVKELHARIQRETTSLPVPATGKGLARLSTHDRFHETSFERVQQDTTMWELEEGFSALSTHDSFPATSVERVEQESMWELEEGFAELSIHDSFPATSVERFQQKTTPLPTWAIEKGLAANSAKHSFTAANFQDNLPATTIAERPTVIGKGSPVAINLSTEVAAVDLKANCAFLGVYRATVYNSSIVSVCLWANTQFPAYTTIDSYPAVYIPCSNFSYDRVHTRTTPFTRKTLRTIAKAQHHLRAIHKAVFVRTSNLVSARVQYSAERGAFVEFGVVAKGFVPLGERPLPKVTGGFKTAVVQAWFAPAGVRERSVGNPDANGQVKVGCGWAVSPVALSTYDTTGIHVPESRLPTFGTLGGCFRTPEPGGRLYGISCGHCFTLTKTSSEFCKKESAVCKSSALAVMLNYMNSQRSEENFHASAEYYCSVGPPLKVRTRGIMAENDAEGLQILAQMAAPFPVIGHLVGGLLGKLHGTDQAVDVAVVCLDEGVFDDADQPEVKELHTQELVHVPSHVLSINAICPSIPEIFRGSTGPVPLYGIGARSNGTIHLELSPHMTQQYVRKWAPSFGLDIPFEHEGPIYDCCGARKVVGFAGGDSGTFLWSESGAMVGMAFGNIGDQCVFFPMEVVRAAVQEIM
jgi:hypothetical protein